MGKISRRAFFLAAGSYAAIIDIFTASREAHAWSKKPQSESLENFVDRCTNVGGTISQSAATTESGEKSYYCSDTKADRACKEIHGEAWFFDEDDGQCLDSSCFLTTACVAEMGLRDDCFELATLRRFRDEVLDKLPGGRAEIACYYRIAPLVVSKLSSTDAPSLELARIYVLYIVPSVIAVGLGRHCWARRIYRQMMFDLCGRLAVPIGWSEWHLTDISR